MQQITIFSEVKLKPADAFQCVKVHILIISMTPYKSYFCAKYASLIARSVCCNCQLLHVVRRTPQLLISTTTKN